MGDYEKVMGEWAVNENITEIVESGFVKGHEKKILKFLKKISLIPFNKREIWYQEIIEFFSEEIIVPYVITASFHEADEMENNELQNMIKQHYLQYLDSPLLHIDYEDLYPQIIRIFKSVKEGVRLDGYAPFFMKLSFYHRELYIQRMDEEDSEFQNFQSGIKIHERITPADKNYNCYNRSYFILADLNSIEYPTSKWHNEIQLDWRKKIRQKLLSSKNPTKKRDPIESRLRHEVFKRDNYRCLECGKGKEDTTLHVDHIRPVSQNGTDELDNLQTLCQACNLAKSNRKWVAGE